MARLQNGSPAYAHWEEWFTRNLAELAGALSLQEATQRAFEEGSGYAEEHYRSLASDVLAEIRDNDLLVTRTAGGWGAGRRNGTDGTYDGLDCLEVGIWRESLTLVGAVRAAVLAIRDTRGALPGAG